MSSSNSSGENTVQLIGHDTSSLTALFLASRGQQGQLPITRAVGELIKRYSFVVFPQNARELDAEKIEFRQGVFKDTGIESFAIYNDGAVITSKSSTEFLDAVLEDIIEWMGKAFSLKHIKTHAISRAYESNLLVHSDAKLLGALNGLSPLQETIGKALKSTMGLEARFEPFGMVFAADSSTIPSLKPSPFRLERRAGLSFGTNYYFTQAPLRTPDHIKLLHQLEKLAK